MFSLALSFSLSLCHSLHVVYNVLLELQDTYKDTRMFICHMHMIINVKNAVKLSVPYLISVQLEM